MRKFIVQLLVAALSQQASAHYVFNRLIINNTASQEFQYVRDVSSNTGDYSSLWLKTFPIYGPENENVTCGRSAFPVHNAATIETATIPAGSEVGFMLSGPTYEGDTQPYIFHEGPGQVFLSKLPAGMKSLNEYDGSGDFFKIDYAGPSDNHTWSTMDKTEVNFTIPAATPSGKYLLRIEQFYPSSSHHQSQWFVNCAHVEIVGRGSGSPGPMVRFPNAYSEDDPSIWFHDDLGRFPDNLDSYVEPKPNVWKG
ncbi:fungal cellulose binding domain-containing protein [Clathrospora elynae]|uniref:lytic cellulose monooxygenase (C4-dehydrogenating) n=1 Tax=Clathrospora elynae TaxID=706981 RepID=A0A6A5SBN4_9PLEO|nr:fungal cellulose binding domain-containing protein [Clathrospora elynae]